jgi:hypothetical protein
MVTREVFKTLANSHLLKASGPDLAAVVKQPFANILPDSVRPIELDRIQALDLDTSRAPGAFDAKEFSWDFR